MKSKSILILSGGLDSTVSSFLAKEESNPILALTFDYGQRAAKCEQSAAKAIASKLDVPHKVMNLPWLKELTHTSLVAREQSIPHLTLKDLENSQRSRESAEAVWVPNRNGLFLNIAACFAESLDAELLVTGFNAEEAQTFPDNSASFARTADDFFWFSTQKKPRVVSFTQDWTKREIAAKSKELGLSIQDVWFCYEGNKQPCRQCESCLRSFRAFEYLERGA